MILRDATSPADVARIDELHEAVRRGPEHRPRAHVGRGHRRRDRPGEVARGGLAQDGPEPSQAAGGRTGSVAGAVGRVRQGQRGDERDRPRRRGRERLRLRFPLAGGSERRPRRRPTSSCWRSPPRSPASCWRSALPIRSRGRFATRWRSPRRSPAATSPPRYRPRAGTSSDGCCRPWTEPSRPCARCTKPRNATGRSNSPCCEPRSRKNASDTSRPRCKSRRSRPGSFSCSRKGSARSPAAT